MHICVISHSYPTSRTIDFVFVDQLCREFADKGQKVSIIAPQSLTKCILRGIPIVKFRSRLTTIKGNNVTLYRPFWISLGPKFTKFVGDSFNKAALEKIVKNHTHNTPFSTKIKVSDDGFVVYLKEPE